MDHFWIALDNNNNNNNNNDNNDNIKPDIKPLLEENKTITNKLNILKFKITDNKSGIDKKTIIIKINGIDYTNLSSFSNNILTVQFHHIMVIQFKK